MAWGKMEAAAVGMPSANRSMTGRSMIGEDVVITGNVAAGSDLHVAGTIEGDLQCASLSLGATGRVRGNITAQNATLAGTVEGTVVANDLMVEKTARVAGDVSYESISIETGARVDGRLSQKAAQTSELKLVTAVQD